MSSGFFANDFKDCVQQILSHGLQIDEDREVREVLNYNFTITNPRNRILTFPKIGTNLRGLYDEAVDVMGLMFNDEHEQALVTLAKEPWARDVETTDRSGYLSLHWVIRQNRLNLIMNTAEANLFDDVPSDVFAYSMLQEGMYGRLLSIVPNLKLGFLMYNIGILSVFGDDLQKARCVADQERVFDVEMIPMGEMTTKIWGEERDGEESVYWRTLKNAMVDDDPEAMHELFGQNDE